MKDSSLQAAGHDKNKAREKALNQQSLFNSGLNDSALSASSEEEKDDLLTDMSGPNDNNQVKNRIREILQKETRMRKKVAMNKRKMIKEADLGITE